MKRSKYRMFLIHFILCIYKHASATAVMDMYGSEIHQMASLLTVPMYRLWFVQRLAPANVVICLKPSLNYTPMVHVHISILLAVLLSVVVFMFQL